MFKQMRYVCMIPKKKELHIYLFFLLRFILTLLLLNTTCPVLANSVDPDQLASSDLDLHCLSLKVWISIKKKTWIK